MIELQTGDVLKVLKDYPDESFNAVFTDPPYGLEFMGKEWDHGVPSKEVWAEALRVLKPGAVLMAFGGTRTFHRLAVAIEDAGFELFDTMMWMYGSGFPKSHNIGKAIDKAAPRVGMFDAFARHFAEQRRKSGLSQKEIAQHFLSKTGGLTGCVWNWENAANVPTLKQWHILQPMLKLSDRFEPLIQRIEAEREVIGQGASGKTAIWNANGIMGNFDITAPATDAAKTWEGYGTALKPAFEPILLARKPRETTYAQTAMEHGTAALNIDGCRVKANDVRKGGFGLGNRPWVRGKKGDDSISIDSNQLGRWPANVILSHHLDCGDGRCHPDCSVRLLGEQSGELKSGAKQGFYDGWGHNREIYGDGKPYMQHCEASSGGASRFFQCFEGERFFYCAKAAKRERWVYLMCDCKTPIIEAWEKEDQSQDAKTGAISRKRAISEASSMGGSDLPTTLSGNENTAQFRGDTPSITSMESNLTIESKTCDWLAPQNTSESMVGASCEKGYGGSLAAFVANSNLSQQSIGTSHQKAIRNIGVAVPAILGASYRTSVCARCGAKVRVEGHPTQKPLALCEYLARLIVPPEEYRDEAALLVPFCGSGSEMIGGLLAGWRNLVGIDIMPEYLEIAKLRIDWWLAKMKETGLTDPRAILKACSKKRKRGAQPEQENLL